MSLRDWFAGQALNGILASHAHPSSTGAIPVDDGAAFFVAAHCYRYADAMLKARAGAEDDASTRVEGAPLNLEQLVNGPHG